MTTYVHSFLFAAPSNNPFMGHSMSGKPSMPRLKREETLAGMETAASIDLTVDDSDEGEEFDAKPNAHSTAKDDNEAQF